MFVRIVKMSFDPTKTEAFLKIFDQNKSKIRHFEGCSFLELYQDKKRNNVYFTYSHWKDDRDLEAYRDSALFKSVWSQTKTLFNDKPEAWSVDVIHENR